MSAKHQDPRYLRAARVLRAQVRASWRNGVEVYCWRRGPKCVRVIEPGTPFDAGHIDPDDPTRLAPECRPCNRGEGGRRGAAITNGRAARPRPVRPTTREGLAPW